MRMHPTAIVIAGFLALSGCGPRGGSTAQESAPAANPEPPAAGPAVPGANPSAPPPPTGTIVGIVRLAEGETVSSWPDALMPRPPGEPVARPDVCGPPKLTDKQSARVADPATRAVSGVLIAPVGFTWAPPPRPVTHELAIRDCILDRPFLAASIGDRVRLTNDTDYPFLPTAGEGPGITQALTRGQTRELTLDRPGPRTVACNAFGLACGRADVMVLGHTLHAVTGVDGRFRIEKVQANTELRIHAWNPLLQESNQTIKLAPGETRTLEFVMRPATIQPPAAPPPAPPRDPREGDIH
jgi:hypothetical protein